MRFGLFGLGLVLLLAGACALDAPKMSGKLDKTPRYEAWSAPRWEGLTLEDECSFTMFATIAWDNPCEIRWRRLLDEGFLPYDMGHKWLVTVPLGRNKVEVWFIKDDETVAYRTVPFNCQEDIGNNTWRGF